MVGTGNAKLSRIGLQKANGRVFACEACGTLVSWMNAFKRVSARGETGIEPGDACTSQACCMVGGRRYREQPHVAHQMERLEGLVAGSHTLVLRPQDTVDMRIRIAGGRRARKIASRACQALRRTLIEIDEREIETRNGPPMLDD